MLEREEYIEQTYFFRLLGERLPQNMPLQDLLDQVAEEILATTKLPMAISFLRSELVHHGVMGPAMRRLGHYFTPFQTYLVEEAENERGRFDMRLALEILRSDAAYRSQGASPAGVFMFQFEALCRNRLRYDPGLKAVAEDPIFDARWQQWILTVRRQVGLVDFADLIYVRSQHWQDRQVERGAEIPPDKPALFGEKEGRIALAHRHKDPLYLFAAMQRHLGYPGVPRPRPKDKTPELLPQILRRLERIESRLKLLEDEQREGSVDLSKFYGPGQQPPG